MSGLLPHDLLFDVLTRLQVKTLVRFVCVSKSWYSIITNPSFITTHLNRSSSLAAVNNNNNNNHRLLVRSLSGDNGEGVRYSLLRFQNDRFCDSSELELPLKNQRNPYLRIVGICNELVCLSYDMYSYQEELYLWNPTIRKTITLPPVRVTHRSLHSFSHTIGFGLGSDDYKVVRIVYIKEIHNDIRSYLEGHNDVQLPHQQVEIFSLSTGTWRDISRLGVPYDIKDRAPQAYLNGAAHWPAFDRNMSYLVLSFHMRDEVFSKIMVPNSIAQDMENVGVAKFQESLSLIDWIWGNETCCVWVMKEYGISESWTKQFNIDMSGDLYTSAIGFTRKGEILFGTRDGSLAIYDPETEQAMHLPISGSTHLGTGESFYADAYTYRESLVLLGANFPVTCKESTVLQGEASGAKKSRKRKAKPKKKGKELAR